PCSKGASPGWIPSPSPPIPSARRATAGSSRTPGRPCTGACTPADRATTTTRTGTMSTEAAGQRGRLQLGAHTLLYRAYPFERALEGVARAGFRYVGLWFEHAGETIVPPDASFGVQDRVRRRIESFGLRPRMTFAYPSGGTSWSAA